MTTVSGIEYFFYTDAEAEVSTEFDAALPSGLVRLRVSLSGGVVTYYLNEQPVATRAFDGDINSVRVEFNSAYRQISFDPDVWSDSQVLEAVWTTGTPGGVDALLPMLIVGAWTGGVAELTLKKSFIFYGEGYVPVPVIYNQVNAVHEVGYSVTAWGGGVLNASLPHCSLTITGAGETLGRMAVTHGGGYTVTGYGGGVLRSILPTGVLTVSGTGEILGRLNARLPFPVLTISGTVGFLASMEATHGGRYSVESYGGGVLEQPLPRPTLTIEGTLTAVGKLAVTLPRLVMVGSGTAGVLARLTATLPMLQLAPSGILYVTLPSLIMQGIGSVNITVEYEAYSITLLPTEVGLSTATTHYTSFPFDRIVRFRDRHYGVAADGLYELGGEEFDGEPIVSVVQTAESSFEHDGFKRIPSLYFSGRVGADMDVSVITGETAANVYQGYRPVIKSGADTHRVIFGKGVRAHYVSFRFSNVAGEDFMIDSMAPQVDKLVRRI